MRLIERREYWNQGVFEVTQVNIGTDSFGIEKS